MSDRTCAWMSGPKDASLTVSPTKWWLAISRDVLASGYRRQACRLRPPVQCNRTPTFSSPLSGRV